MQPYSMKEVCCDIHFACLLMIKAGDLGPAIYYAWKILI